ncbi:MAG: hypothetical protein R3308_06805 [Thiohalobacterales bacterium]|nr:hypothetical protein [Thiohalobacterales bacterium]
MRTKTDKLLLVLMILALAVTPLRGASAFAPADSSEPASKPHCASMDMPAAEQHVEVTDEGGHPCKYGCNGDCCDDSCTTCALSPVSLLNSVALAPAMNGMSLAVPVAAAFPHRTVIPPLRPPASL